MSHWALQVSLFVALLSVWIAIDRLKQLRSRRQQGRGNGK